MITEGIFTEEKICEYKGETYSVRNNGAVLRHSDKSTRKRKLDNIWTFGTIGIHNYLYIGGEAVHRIVATAFIGNAPSSQHIVDHIDTNRRNNRPENLRWLTRLENIKLNPATVKKIELKTGLSIDEVLRNPSILHDLKEEENYSWMTTVTHEEAMEALKTRNLWLKKFENSKGDNAYKPKESFFHESLTPNAVQVNQWRTEGYFPCVAECRAIDLNEYLSKIKKGVIIFQAKKILEYKFIVESAEISPDQKSLFVICSEPVENVKPHVFLKITVEEKMFIHTHQSYFDANGPKRNLELAMGREWAGGNIIDDYC